MCVCLCARTIKTRHSRSLALTLTHEYRAAISPNIIIRNPPHFGSVSACRHVNPFWLLPFRAHINPPCTREAIYTVHFVCLVCVCVFTHERIRTSHMKTLRAFVRARIRDCAYTFTLHLTIFRVADIEPQRYPPENLLLAVAAATPSNSTHNSTAIFL